MAELEQKMAMSRSIMKKLYHKNVELEKELAIVKANHGGVDLTQPPTMHGPLRPATAAAGLGLTDTTPSFQALQERDLTIRQLQQALEASRRRCSLLEMQLANGVPGGGPGAALGGTGGRGGGLAGLGAQGVNPDSLRDMLAQSALHHQKYKQIREDYNRLLKKRASALQTGSRYSAATAVAARTLVEDLRKRLDEEVQEREAEAALYSAKLYESEKAMSDWYVEKRLLEDHITRLTAELAERDKIDGEIEGCVTAMLERLRTLEAENEELRGRLSATSCPNRAVNPSRQDPI
ncbi:hypothetical protein VOLCADRAFT_116749 [Volvox carteri f. nagariensis]|uniref:Uncharacterized protein n=1 Tax=Volvox carteri f. nagariensis TaxID=3068 RepID=D8TP91_VOLCA|nr:uncharacterized protein VOLCADRAFT_116749 [Volvox carteri f. nagariensis]EFJ50720.1 hypothetical protein VOLCADRAFT_116749 [Volvox carteri f. nagariensis]|eukprot:XP_002948313.1 hypothetical protein VOLCADRAFT_116749 [Volvox carteri f. nagariensis]